MPRHTYLISNRSTSDPDNYIGPLSWQNAPNHSDRPYKSEGFKAYPADAWTESLIGDLRDRYQGSTDTYDIAFYIHGYATSEKYARIGLESLGLGLTSVGFDRGILVGVSWPSNTWTYGGAQTNATMSGPLLTACGNIVGRLRYELKRAVRATLFCHSMGNYLASTTLAAGSAKLPAIDSIFMLAADVDYALWDPKGSSYAQGIAIKSAAKQVYVLYTQNDTVLRDSGIINNQTRLGYYGAKSVSQLPSNVAQFDYSAWGNDPYCNDYVPYSYYNSLAGTGALIHSSSKFIPDLLSFEVAGMQNVPGKLDVAAMRDLPELKRLVMGTSKPDEPAKGKGAKRAKRATQ
jgi:hypothetical protein